MKEPECVKKDPQLDRNWLAEMKEPQSLQQMGRIRLNSFYLRELMSGKFCIPSEQILQLEIIGQGILYVVLLSLLYSSFV